MKRAGHIYEQMADWSNIVEAEKISTRRKSRKIVEKQGVVVFEDTGEKVIFV